MQKALENVPVLDPEELRAKTVGWKDILKAAGPGGNRVVIEWNVQRGPNVFLYPATKRAAGVQLVAASQHAHSDERWADYLEYDYLPKLVDAVKGDGMNPQLICVDLRPLQIQRARRRAIEQNARAKTGEAAHH